MNTEGRKIVLASGSPRRKELMKLLYDSFDVIESNCMEMSSSMDPEEMTKEIAMQKALHVAEEHQLKDAVIIAADTVVNLDYEIMVKPKDRDDAYMMIQRLNGRSHQVSTGVAVLMTDSEARVRLRLDFAETTIVEVAPMEEEEIQAYLDTNEPYDKAGGYAIQGAFAKHITKIVGDYNNVVGLPVARIYKEINEF